MNGHPSNEDIGGELLEAEKTKPKLKKPPLYKVILLNDDYTPMDFVVEILEYFFSKSREEAVQIMMQIHVQGKGICGVFSKDVAETKAAQVNAFSRSKEYPLLCTIEVE